MFRDSIIEPELVVPSGDIRAARRRIEAVGRRYHLPVSKPLEIAPPKLVFPLLQPIKTTQITNEHEILGKLRELNTAKRKPTLVSLLKKISEASGIPEREIKGERRTREIAFVRHFFCYEAYRLTGKSTTIIGRFLGGRDHSTVVNSIKVWPERERQFRANPEKWGRA